MEPRTIQHDRGRGPRCPATWLIAALLAIAIGGSPSAASASARPAEAPAAPAAPAASGTPESPQLADVTQLEATSTDATRLLVQVSTASGWWRLDRASGVRVPVPDHVAVSGDLSAVITTDRRWLDIGTGAAVPLPTAVAAATAFLLTRDGGSYVALDPVGGGWVVDARTGAATRLSVTGTIQSISPNGRFVVAATACEAATATRPARCDAVRLDRTTGAVTTVSRRARDEQVASNVADTGRVLVLVPTSVYSPATRTWFATRRPVARDVGGTSTRTPEFGGPEPSTSMRLSDDGTVALVPVSLTACCPGWLAIDLVGGTVVDVGSNTRGFLGVLTSVLTGDGRHVVQKAVEQQGLAIETVTTVRAVDLAGSPARALLAGRTAEIAAAGVAAGGAVIANITVTDPSAAGFLTAWPCGQARPLAANITFAAGSITGSAAIVGVGAGGTICLSSNVDVDVVVDVQGSLPAAAYHALTPARLVDTRDGQLDDVPNLAARTDLVVPVAGHGGVGAGATTVALSLSVTNPVAAGFVTVWPCDEPRPTAADINVAAGETRSNLVVAKLSSSGTVCAWSNVATDIVVDAQGWFEAGSGISAITPVRLLDSRQGAVDGVPRLAAGQRVEIAAPTGASAVVLEVAVDDASAAGFVTVWPCDQPQPFVSNLNFTPGAPVANAVVASVSTTGTVCAAASVAADLVVDLQATLAGAGSVVAGTPSRLLDTRL